MTLSLSIWQVVVIKLTLILIQVLILIDILKPIIFNPKPSLWNFQ